MSLASSYVDAEGTAADWINSLNQDLVGPGHPLQKGAHLTRLTGARTECYALVSQVGGTVTGGAENPDQRARISAQIYGPTKADTAAAGAAYVNALLTLDGKPVVVASAGAVILCVDSDSITGPIWVPDFDEARHIVDCDFHLRPA